MHHSTTKGVYHPKRRFSAPFLFSILPAHEGSDGVGEVRTRTFILNKELNDAYSYSFLRGGSWTNMMSASCDI